MILFLVDVEKLDKSIPKFIDLLFVFKSIKEDGKSQNPSQFWIFKISDKDESSFQNRHKSDEYNVEKTDNL